MSLQSLRQAKIDSGDLIEIETPMLYRNPLLKKKFAFYKSITMAIDVINELNNLQSRSLSLQKMIQNIGYDFWSAAEKAKDEGREIGYNFAFETTMITKKHAVKIQMLAVAHPEPNFKGQEKCTAITFMFDRQEDEQG